MSGLCDHCSRKCGRRGQGADIGLSGHRDTGCLSPWPQCPMALASGLHGNTALRGSLSHRHTLGLLVSIPQTFCLASSENSIKIKPKEGSNTLVSLLKSKRKIYRKTQALPLPDLALPLPAVFICETGPLLGHMTGSHLAGLRSRGVCGGDKAWLRLRNWGGFPPPFPPPAPRSSKTESEHGPNRFSQALRRFSETQRMQVE